MVICFVSTHTPTPFSISFNPLISFIFLIIFYVLPFIFILSSLQSLKKKRERGVWDWLKRGWWMEEKLSFLEWVQPLQEGASAITPSTTIKEAEPFTNQNHSIYFINFILLFVHLLLWLVSWVEEINNHISTVKMKRNVSVPLSETCIKRVLTVSSRIKVEIFGLYEFDSLNAKSF